MNQMSQTKSIILFSEDFDYVRETERSLKANGVNVAGVGFDGKQAVELYFKLKPDIVILDLFMARVDGFHAIENIRGDSLDTKIIAMTKYPFKKSLIEHLGVNVILTKPVSVEQLLKEIEKVTR